MRDLRLREGLDRGEWPGAESNCRHADFQSAALPTELPGRAMQQKNLAGCVGRRECRGGRPLLEEPLHLSRRRKPAIDVVTNRLGALEREREIRGWPAGLPLDEGEAQVFERGHGFGERFARVAS